jgi:hypothetical protein
MMKFLTLFSLLLATAAGAAPSAGPSASPIRPAASPPAGATSPDALFSRRALRRARLLIQMRLLQLHDERLDCIRAALLRRLPGALWPEEPSPARGTPDVATAVARCEEFLRF